ncbi:phage tail tube protein [Burkholderiaceae bacterium UC74_6]
MATAQPILIRSSAVLAKIEATAGTDANPTGAVNAIKVSNLSPSPLEGEFVSRATVQPYLGNSDQVQVAYWAKLSFDVEVAGAGAAGSAPQYGVLLQGCGFSETLTATTSAVYAPITTGFKTLTIYTYIGGTLYKMRMASGNVSLTLNSRGIPQFHFEFTGLYSPVTDAALPATTYTDIKPVAISAANTPTFTLLGYSALMRQLSIDMKNEVNYRNLVGEESVRLTDREPEGNVEIQSTKVADKNWWSSIQAGTVGAMSLVHGTVAGNIVQFDAPAVQMTTPSFTEDKGIQMMRSNLVLKPSAGNDELTITVK